jgi:hypothetical protein
MHEEGKEDISDALHDETLLVPFEEYDDVM